MVGYYNGSDIGLLEDDVHPNGSDKVCHELSAVADALRDSDVLTGLATCTYRFRQITVEAKESLDSSVVLGYHAADCGPLYVIRGHIGAFNSFRRCSEHRSFQEAIGLRTSEQTKEGL